jgi:hypothetical protein
MADFYYSNKRCKGLIVADERFKAVIDKIPAFYDIFPSGIRKDKYDTVI